MARLEVAVRTLNKECQTFPKTPFPQSGFRAIHKKRGFVIQSGTVRFGKNRKSLDKDAFGWQGLIIRECSTPRQFVRVVARIDAAIDWCYKRQQGVTRHRLHTEKSQSPWLAVLEAREGFGNIHYIDLNPTFQELGKVYPNLPERTQEQIFEAHKKGAHKKLIAAIKEMREHHGIGLADAKDAVEAWLRVNGIPR